MDFDIPTIVILIGFFGVIVGLLWEWYGDWSDEFREWWDELDWKDDEINDDEDKRTKSGKK